MQVKSLRASCSTRSLMEAWTTSMLFSWRSFTGSRLVRPPGLASASRRSSWVAKETAWPGGSSLKVSEREREGDLNLQQVFNHLPSAMVGCPT